jgi:cytochrome c-type biogenesis protein CcmE
MGKKKYLIGGIIILLAIGSLGFMAFRGAATYYYTVSEILGKGSAIYGQNVRIAGQVATGSVQKLQPNENAIQFVLVDLDSSSSRVSVNYKGAIPDAFKEGNEAVVEGHMTPTGAFYAQQIIVKCPSKYEPK